MGFLGGGAFLNGEYSCRHYRRDKGGLLRTGHVTDGFGFKGLRFTFYGVRVYGLRT